MSWVRSGWAGDVTLGERALCALLESSYGVVTGEKGYFCSQIGSSPMTLFIAILV